MVKAVPITNVFDTAARRIPIQRKEQCLFQLIEELAFQGLLGDLAHNVPVKFVKNSPFGSCNLLASVLGWRALDNNGPKAKPLYTERAGASRREREGWFKRES